MKALTVQQPWAWAIMHGGKLTENRTQNWKYRGPLAIHAGVRWSDRGGESELVADAWMHHGPIDELIRVPIDEQLDADSFAFGAILGTVDLVDVHPDTRCCKPWGESEYVEHGGSTRRLVTHLVLENPRPLVAPIPCKGALGLWTPNPDLLAQLGEA